MTTSSNLNSRLQSGTKSSPATAEEKSGMMTYVGRNIHDFFEDMPWLKLTRTAVEVDSRGMRDQARRYPENTDFISPQSAEVLCHIFSFLPVQDVLKMQYQNKKMQHAVMLYLKLLRSIDFGYGEILSNFPSKLSDSVLIRLMEKCPHLENIYSFHPQELTPRRFRNCPSLSVPGCIDAFLVLPCLKGVEISDPALFEAILMYLPHLHIIGAFKNRACFLSKEPFYRLTLPASPNVTTLNLTGVTVPEISRLTTVRHLFLHCVHLTHPLPFRDFLAPMLQTFVMANCVGPSHSLKYVSLFTGLAAGRNLSRLELIRVPFLGGIFQHIVEDSWRVQGFQNLRKITMAACKFALELDLGFLAITSAQRLEEMLIQPSLARDSFFSALKVSEATFPNFKRLSLGHVDTFGQSKADRLILADTGELFGVSEVKENPALVTDMGMAAAAHCFPALTSLTINNCPHLHLPHTWLISGMNTWTNLQHLSLCSCHAMTLESLQSLVAQLHSLTTLFLESMFREPPKGCSRVGLSAGTGLGVSAALVQNHNSLTNHANGAPVVDAYAGEENDSEDSDDEERLGGDAEGNEGIPQFREEENADEAEMMEINNNDPVMENIEENNTEGNRHAVNLSVYEEHNIADSKQENCSGSAPALAGNRNDVGGRDDEHYEEELLSASGLVTNMEPLQSHMSNLPGSSSESLQHEPSVSASAKVDFQSRGDESPVPCCSIMLSQNEAKELIGHQHQEEGASKSSSTGSKKTAASSSSARCPWQLRSHSLLHSEAKRQHKVTTGMFSVEETGESFSSLQNRSKDHDYENGSDVDADDKNHMSGNLQHIENSRCLSQEPSSQVSEELASDSEALTRSRQLAEETSAWLQWDSSSELDELHHSWYQSSADRDCPQNLTTSTVAETLCFPSSDPRVSSLDSVSVPGPSGMSPLPSCGIGEKEFAVPGHTSGQPVVPLCTPPSISSSGNFDRRLSDSDELDSVNSSDFLECGSGVNHIGLKPSSCDQQCVSSKSFDNDTRTLRPRNWAELSLKQGSDKKSVVNKQTNEKNYHGQNFAQTKSSNTKINENSLGQELATHGADGQTSFPVEGPLHPLPRPFKGKGLLGKKKSVAKRSRGLSDDGGFAELSCPVCPYKKDKWCQANNDEIRDSIRRVREQEDNTANQGKRSRASNSGSGPSNKKPPEEVDGTLAQVSGEGDMPHAGARQCTCLSRAGKSPPIMVSKATSTSDPVYEEDHVQVLKLHSDSLAHITLRMVGITELRLMDCPRLKSVRGSACRVLRNVKVEHSPLLGRVQWAQCTKLDTRSVLESACQGLDDSGSCVIILRPMMEINEEELTQELLTLPDIKKHVCVVFDYSPNPTATLYNQHRMANWAELFHAINRFCLDNLQFPSGKLSPSKSSSISRVNCYSLKGLNCNDSVWHLTTDFPWLWHLSHLMNNPVKEMPSYCEKAGLFCKEVKGYTKNEDCIDALMPVLKDNRKPLYLGTIFIYINMCDVTGVPTPDVYV